jgi:glycosyltransferase involved in cell wall biosynthesis
VEGFGAEAIGDYTNGGKQLMVKIFFAGELRSPFIKQDMELLQEDHEISVFDLSTCATTKTQMITRYPLALANQIANIIRSDILFIWYADYPEVPLLILAKIFGKPTIVNIGGAEVVAAPEIGYGHQLSRSRGFIARWILRKSSMNVVPSSAYVKITNNLVPSAKVIAIPNYIDSGLCDMPLPKKNPIATTAVCASQTRLLKGIPTFEAATKGRPYKSVIVKNMPHDKLMEYFRQCKVYCQLSYTETFGMSLLEAMACGCVPVVTDRDALPEVVGDCGLIVPYNDIQKTKQAIEQAMSMSGEPARDRARQFNKERKRTSINNLIAELVK